MPSIRFTGHVLPAEFELSLDAGAKIRWQIDQTGFSVDFEARIDRGAVTVECEYEGSITQQHLEAMYIRAFDVARASVDLVSFASGCGLIVVLDKVIDHIGVSSGILPEDKSVAPICTAYEITPTLGRNFFEVYRIVLSNPAIFMALNDLIVGLSHPHYAPVNCYRAIEGIRHLIAPGLGAKKQWSLMNEALRIEQSFVDVIRINATEQRHGNRIPVAGPTVREIVRKSWMIMNRFLEYRKRGVTPLPQSEFPLLI